jgi:hypothetical protein
MKFDTRVEDLVVLVTDRTHGRHGQIGAMLYHDWSENAGPSSFQRKYLELGGSLEQLAEQYRVLFGEDLPQMPENSD